MGIKTLGQFAFLQLKAKSGMKLAVFESVLPSVFAQFSPTFTNVSVHFVVCFLIQGAPIIMPANVSAN
jgi:hypothetical protein